MKPRKSYDHTRWLKIADIAEILDFSERQVRRWIDDGDLVAHKFGRQWRISDKDFEEYLRSRRRGGSYVL
jgi:excisionase family DNA binding protein